MKSVHVLLLAPVLFACAGWATDDDSGTEPAFPPLISDIANADVHGVYEDPVTLTDGRYAGPPYEAGGTLRPTVTLGDRLSAWADIDDDGREETAVILEENSGGSGHFLYLGVFGWASPDELRTLGAVRLDDRIQIRSLTVERDHFVVHALAAGGDDAACCPTTKTRYEVSFQDGALTVTSELRGAVGLPDLAENGWRLQRLSGDEEVPEGIEVTFQLTPGGGISGSAGCNRFSGHVESDPSIKSFEVGTLAATRRMCPPDFMAVEDRFLELMGIVEGYSWQQGQLMLSYVRPEFDAMYFDPVVELAGGGDGG